MKHPHPGTEQRPAGQEAARSGALLVGQCRRRNVSGPQLLVGSSASLTTNPSAGIEHREPPAPGPAPRSRRRSHSPCALQHARRALSYRCGSMKWPVPGSGNHRSWLCFPWTFCPHSRFTSLLLNGADPEHCPLPAHLPHSWLTSRLPALVSDPRAARLRISPPRPLPVTAGRSRAARKLRACGQRARHSAFESGRIHRI